jgi:predicted nuclease with TOPRIM domain
MNDLAPTITDLKGKIEKLVKLHQQLKQENDALAAEKTGLQKTVEEQKATIEALEKSKRELEQKKSEEQNTIITDTKLKINELVQEIDDCIALLK